jgi:hypothetical protein
MLEFVSDFGFRHSDFRLAVTNLRSLVFRLRYLCLPRRSLGEGGLPPVKILRSLLLRRRDLASFRASHSMRRGYNFLQMKNLIRSAVGSVLVIAASAAFGAVPPVTVIVSDAGGKAAFKGVTNAKGTFATATLPPGHYVVQFNSDKTTKGSTYTVVVAAGNKKISSNSVAGEKFNKGGVALKVDVVAGQSINGQVAESAAGAVSKSGKKMVWIPPQLGSNRPGHYAEEGSAEAVEAKNAGSVSTDQVREMQSH